MPPAPVMMMFFMLVDDLCIFEEREEREFSEKQDVLRGWHLVVLDIIETRLQLVQFRLTECEACPVYSIPTMLRVSGLASLELDSRIMIFSTSPRGFGSDPAEVRVSCHVSPVANFGDTKSWGRNSRSIEAANNKTRRINHLVWDPSE